MPAAKLDDECWTEVKTAWEQGVDDLALSHDFGVSREAIRKRRERDKKAGRPWLSQAMIKAEAEKSRIDRRVARSNNKTLSVTSVTAVESVAAQIGKIAEKNGLRVAQMADRALREVADSPPAVESWSDAAQAYKLLRLAAGLDREGVALQVNLGGVFSQKSPDQSPVVDCS